ncbi:MAG: AAA family ATPase [Candidatus Pacebacteria bacterium]|nr:AAA family ATPase [Candidatus Paceibacterota bacterium]
MYIKQVKIDSFKSYGQQSIKGELSPQLNVIVGPNGFGKSNLLNGTLITHGL